VSTQLSSAVLGKELSSDDGQLGLFVVKINHIVRTGYSRQTLRRRFFAKKGLVRVSTCRTQLFVSFFPLY
jgi:hypothetical protein